MIRTAINLYKIQNPLTHSLIHSLMMKSQEPPKGSGWNLVDSFVLGHERLIRNGIDQFSQFCDPDP